MMHGVFIDGVNTLSEFGLALLADVTIGSPKPKTTYIDIPEADGDLDITAALTGGDVRYEMRTVKFSLFPVHDVISGTRSPATEQHSAMIRQKLAELVHGKSVKLWLPDDGEHYFVGRMSIDDKGGFNKTTIPVTMTAEPWRYKNRETIITVTEDSQVIARNETKRVTPVFETESTAAYVTFGNIRRQLEPGSCYFRDIVLSPGVNALGFEGVTDPVTIRYQEAVL